MELRLHSATGLPSAGTAVVVEVDLGDGTKWRSAPAASHGGAAYLGAWVAVQPAAAQLLFRVHDQSSSAIRQCSGGIVSAYGTLHLPPTLTAPLGGESGDAPTPGAPAAAAAKVEEADAAGWRHVTLELEAGTTARLAQAVEKALGGAAQQQDAWAAALEQRAGAGGATEPGDEAAAQQAELPASQRQQGDDTASGAPAARQTAVVLEMPPLASRSGSSAPEAPDADQEQQQQGRGPPAAPAQQVPDGGAANGAGFIVGGVTLRLSYRPLRQPPSSLAAEPGAGAADAPPASSPSLTAARTLIRLVSRRPLVKSGAGADAAPPPPGCEDVEAAAALDERRHAWQGRGEERAGAQLAEAVAEGLPLELPLVPLPRRLHCYGHGAFMGAALSMLGSRRWQGILRREDPLAFASAKRVSASMRLLAKSRRKQGLTRYHLALMPCLENNPVLAAYGAIRSGSAAAVDGPEATAEHEDGETVADEESGAGAAAAERGLEAAAGGGDTALAAPQQQQIESGPDEVAGAAVKEAVSTAAQAAEAQQLRAEQAQEQAVQLEPSLAGEPPPEEQEQQRRQGALLSSQQQKPDLGDSTPQPEQQADSPPQIQQQQRQPAVETAPVRDLLVAGLRKRGLHEAADGIERYQRALRRPNRYGYLPIAQEWDIWISPHAPAAIAAAGISHGSASQLVAQAVTTAMPCTRSCARSAGEALILKQGTSPVDWLNAFGHAINAGATGSRSLPLPLASPPQRWWRLRLTLHGVEGLPIRSWERPYLKAGLASSAVALPDCRTERGRAQGPLGFVWSATAKHPAWRKTETAVGGAEPDACGAELSFWPLPLGLDSGEELQLELRGDPAGIVADTQVGRAGLPLQQLLQRCPQLAAGEAVHLEVPVSRAPRAESAAATEAAAAVLGARAAAGGSGEQHPTAAGPQPAAVRWCGCIPGAKAAATASRAAQQTLDFSILPGLAKAHIGSAAAAMGRPPPAGMEPGGQTAAAADPAATAAGPRLVLAVRLEPVDCLEAAVAVGVERAAAQSCLAMLSEPGGLYLDVKSAYSTPHDLQLFVSMLKGLGITTKAVCSFQPKQLKIAPGIARTVLFFHGLSGLENACDAGRVAPGQFVLFNGASFLADLSLAGLQLPEDRAAELLSSCRQYPLDALVVRRYKGLVEQYGFAGGIYVQEPDTGASAAQALIGLLRANETFFPLGFAYGHVRDAAVSVLELGGRGFASQEILEELAARSELSAKVIRRIGKGEHRGVSPNVAATWASRLVSSSKLLSLREQRTLIALLAELQPGQGLLSVLDDLGGIPRIVLRFVQHYESTTPMTLLEAGWNFNHQKPFLRLLRNHGALAALPVHRKVELARFFIGPQLRGYGLTYVLMLTRLRLGLHKHGKEGLLCLLESCTRDEYQRVLLALGGRGAVAHRLRGRWRLSWHYLGRLADVEVTHAADPHGLAYQNRALGYAALPEEEGDAEGGSKRDHLHTRHKSPREQVGRQARKLACCACSLGNWLGLSLLTLGLFTPFCLVPRCIGATFKGTCAMPAALALLLGLLAAIALYVLLPDLVNIV